MLELSIKKKNTFMNRFNLLERYEILNIKLSELKNIGQKPPEL